MKKLLQYLCKKLVSPTPHKKLINFLTLSGFKMQRALWQSSALVQAHVHLHLPLHPHNHHTTWQAYCLNVSYALTCFTGHNIHKL